ncbi:leucyl aminopeptidase [bacterium]|nr:leucyl aminopeptidase [bacterium]|tara:strand:- start:450 stop:1832 length:1383 start_codon:yes stop_codon:yes gene_type:complete
MKFHINQSPTKKHIEVSFDSKETLRVSDDTIRIGVQDAKKVSMKKFSRLARSIVRTAHAHRASHLTIDWDSFKLFPILASFSDAERAERIAIEMLLANYSFTAYKTTPKNGWPTVKEVLFTGVPQKSLPAVKSALARSVIIGEEMNAARTLANTPGSDMPPKKMSLAAQKAAQGIAGLKVSILGTKEMKRLGMGAILGVGQGSVHESQFIVLEYSGGKKGEKPVALVGKGITYDTGGLGLKPADAMMGMHMDMTGGALVIHAITLAARLKTKRNIVAVVAAAENAVGKESYRMGDILKGMSGKMIEVRHTDAEGRLVLSDALTYVQKKFSPKLIIDVATLTGAALVALGQSASILLSRDEKLAWDIHMKGNAVGDCTWPLPLWDDFKPELESKVADISNIGKTRYGGTINGGMFLAEFVDEKQPWVHIDIAPRMESVEGDHLADGATGEPMRLLLKMVQE